MDDSVLLVKKLSYDAIIPSKASPLAAGFDLHAASDCLIHSHDKALIFTDISMSLPPGSYGRIAPRSGLALNNFIQIGGGVIDNDYRGNVGVLIFNHGHSDFQVKKHDRIAQIIVEKNFYPKIVITNSLDETVKNSSGFGSSGL